MTEVKKPSTLSRWDSLYMNATGCDPACRKGRHPRHIGAQARGVQLSAVDVRAKASGPPWTQT